MSILPFPYAQVWRTGTLSAEVSRSASPPRQPPQKQGLHPVNPLGPSRRAEKGGSCRRRRRCRGGGEAKKGGAAPPPFPAHLSVRGAGARLHKGMRGGGGGGGGLLLYISAASRRLLATRRAEVGGGGGTATSPRPARLGAGAFPPRVRASSGRQLHSLPRLHSQV